MAASTSPSTILLTGATGLVGAATLFQLMHESSHTVIAVLRSRAKSEAFLATKYAPQISAGRLSFLEIPDMTSPGVFDDAATQSDAIIHIATPLAYDDVIEKVVKPSGTIVHNVLLAADKSERTKRVIVTGSIVSTFRLPNDLFSGKTVSAESWNDIPYEEAGLNPANAYQYSKTHSEQQAWKFMSEKTRSFDLIYLLAPAITGKSIHQGFVPSKEALGGQAGIYRDLFDKEKPGFLFPYFMDVEDVAKVHVMSLAPSVPGNERYLFHSPELMTGNDMARAVREDFPQLRSRVPAPDVEAGDAVPPNLVKTDISKAEKVFGTVWKSARQTTRETVADIIAFENRKQIRVVMTSMDINGVYS
ncbi:hypothetical protein LTR10_019195 [Elasticomyces elasticus]|uniref:NAD-dependent epimerase/dehydratase domain-containing protein n=1 Tax=Exophiala sideris TaxID=1016849 RepID=A0ABR0J856_9EURO|nr:hypothetical protein LTR10_019195 [Elasticomyces elasticus]KAK5025515.1 hypothetical protein LTR13_010479 [Exophiala sideris]KAK5029788.1 hypothetical protein LTS07_005512 [Exophiala sideris]KAK5058450.1 hypothetical protein LTR69_006855 [Exophiala sideris]KAK5178577.1 hypothetical protein LTR44_008948 [Eurotiomycetes sp. CCFEE 6388]